jgi:enolase-phosphatase E1
LLDIEGTVGAASFVHEVLFPYARARLEAFVRAHRDVPDIAEQLAEVAQSTGATGIDELIAVLQRWHDEDRKATPLKSIHGRIWSEGYASGELVGHLYSDAVDALRRWAAAKLPVYLYSSGSVQAQKLYFTHSCAGDLLSLVQGQFDTTVGPKTAASSYRVIARALAPARFIDFYSDVAAELEAAPAAGVLAMQVRRPGFAGRPHEPFITRFDELDY